MSRFESMAALLSKIGWEGGIGGALEYGISEDDIPEGHGELAAAWADLRAAYNKVEALLPSWERP